MVSITIKKTNDKFFGSGYSVSINGKKEYFTSTKKKAESGKKQIQNLINKLSRQ